MYAPRTRSRLGIRVLTLSSCFVSSLALAQSTQFITSPSQPGVWLPNPHPKTATKTSPNGTALPAASPEVSALPGFKDPAAIVRVGTDFYVGNNENNQTKTISVIDASLDGGEFVSQTFATPVDPVDFQIKGNEIFVVDQKRSPVWWRPLSGSTWSSIPIPVAIDEWTYGNECFAHPTQNKLFVLDIWGNKIHVVDLATKTLQTTITNLHHLPTSMAFSFDGSKMAVLCNGLSAPSCSASGPNLAVFDSTTFTKLYEVNLQGTCSRALTTDGKSLYVVRDTGVLRFDFNSGTMVASISLVDLGRNATFNGNELVVQDSFLGKVMTIAADLSTVNATFSVVAGPPAWSPPIEEMAVFEDGDPRIFVTNRNDDSVSIIHYTPDCQPYGTGCPGSGGFTPTLKNVGCPIAGSTFKINVARGLGGAAMLLFAGTGTSSIPLGGGCTYLLAPVLPPLFQTTLPGVGPGNGGVSLGLPVPANLPVGLSITLQVALIDPGALAGFTCTNALALASH